jgi:hypothetical protein
LPTHFYVGGQCHPQCLWDTPAFPSGTGFMDFPLAASLDSQYYEIGFASTPHQMTCRFSLTSPSHSQKQPSSGGLADCGPTCHFLSFRLGREWLVCGIFPRGPRITATIAPRRVSGRSWVIGPTLFPSYFQKRLRAHTELRTYTHACTHPRMSPTRTAQGGWFKYLKACRRQVGLVTW